jgi:hypothetical protein
MIFDSHRVQSLMLEYESEPDFLLPSVVFLARSKKLENECLYIESLIRQVAPAKHKEWLSRLLNVDDAQYLGAWFEIMLFGWMKNVGVVEVEPIIKGNYPDLSVVIGEQKAFVEARVVLKTISERNEEKFTNWIFWALRKIQKPYGISVIDAKASKLPQLADFCSKVENWLETTPQEKYVYEGGSANIVMEVIGEPNPKYGSIQAIGSIGEAKWIISEPLKEPLREKAHQHKAIRKASLPYIIAIFLDSPFLSAEEIAKAWFGEEKWVIRAVGDEHKVVDSYIDKSGIHFFGSEIRHKSISGTLVFKSEFIEAERRHFLKSWYIQNPFAQTPIDSTALPVQGHLVVIERSETGFRLGWKNGKDFYENS